MPNYSQTWLEDPSSIRGLLVEVGVAIYNSSTLTWVDSTIYLSNIGYVTGDSSTIFLPYLTGSLQTSESISIDGSLSMSFGDIEVANSNGILDDWLDSSKYVWVNRGIQVYLGDPRWYINTLNDLHDTSVNGFLKVFDGIVSDIDSSSRDVLNIKVRDKLERLNTPITENRLGTYGTWGQGQNNQDTIRPLIFGEVFNISPVLVDPSKLEYMYNDTNAGTIITSTTVNTFTCSGTGGFKLGNKIVFSGVLLPQMQNIVLGTTYYILTVPSLTTFTVSATLNGAAITVGTTSSVTTSTLQAEAELCDTELLLEIRDNGNPIFTTASIYSNVNITRPSAANIVTTTGKFTLTQGAVGSITCSVQGVKRSINLNTGNLQEGTYTNRVAKLIALIVTNYGTTTTRLLASDLDLTNLLAFDNVVDNQHAVGYAVLDRENLLSVCQKLANSVNASLFMNRLGKLQLLQLGTPTSDAVTYITDNDILHHSLYVSNKTQVIAATQVAYCKNYTVQTALAASLPGAHADMFKEGWLLHTITDTNIQVIYKLDAQPPTKETALINKTGAVSLATKINNYWKVARIVYAFEAQCKHLSLKLGQQVNLTHNRFGLNSGKTGQVISLSPNWVLGTVKVEVII